MELRQLRYFKMVADAGSFARAAQDLRVAQPALSRSIAKLEEELGVAVFTRHSAGVTLTDGGVRCYDHAVQVLGSVRSLVEGMSSVGGVLRGAVSLGAPHSIQSKLIRPVATEFLLKFDQCRLDLVQNSGSHLRNQVAEGRIDLAIIPNTTEGGMHLRPLLRESICLICRSEDRPAFGAEIEIGDLLMLPLLLTGYPDSLRLYIDRTFPHQAESLNIRSEVNSSAILAELVTNGVGYGVAPSGVVSLAAEGDLAFVPIRGLEVSWAIATNWNRRGQRAVDELQSLLTAHVEESVLGGSWPTARIGL